MDDWNQDPIQIEDITARNWESVIDTVTADMDPWAIDIITLADRYRTYIEQREFKDLEIPARMIFVCAVLLRMKANVLSDDEDDDRQQDDEMMPEQEELYEEDDAFEEPEEQLAIPQTTLKPAVDRDPKRRVSLDELKGALEKAVEIQERRKERRHERLEQEDEQEFIDIQEDAINERLDQLVDRLTDIFDKGNDAVSFIEMIDRRDREEKLETFRHILHLETDEKIECEQEEFFGDIEIRPGKQLM